MKRVIILGVLFVGVFNASAQQRDTTVTLPQIADSLIQKKLVELATAGPSSEIIEHQNQILHYQLKGAKNAWLNLFTLSFNYNELSMKGGSTSYVYPRYFVGFNVPLGTILSRTQVKASKEQIKVKGNEMEILRRNVTTGIQKMYLQYKHFISLVVLQRNVSDDEETSYLKAKTNFKNGLMNIEIYTQAQKRYTEELIKAKQLELDRDMLKLEIEGMIGMTLEDAIREAAADKIKADELKIQQLKLDELKSTK
jgi:outer membrane protein TolC